MNILFHQHRETYISLRPDTLVKSVATTVEEAIKDGRPLKVIRNAEQIFEVQRASKEKEFRIVDIESFTCS